MINLLEEYVANSVIARFDGSPENTLYAFRTNPNLKAKVEGRKLKPFFGNTAVFLLEEETRKILETCQKELYRNVGWMLAEPLKAETFHMTLHDLVNGPEEDARLKERMQKAEAEAGSILAQWRSQAPLQMTATWLFNMVDTSIVLGLAPADEESARRLDALYTALEPVVPLNRGLTPHITMAYYRPDAYTIYDANCLKGALHPVKLDVTLDMKNLVLQKFTSMNDYRTIG